MSTATKIDRYTLSYDDELRAILRLGDLEKMREYLDLVEQERGKNLADVMRYDVRRLVIAYRTIERCK